MPTSIPYDDLVKKISADSNTIASICRSNLLSIPSYKCINFNLNLLMIIYTSRNLLKEINVMQRDYCEKCTLRCDLNKTKKLMESSITEMKKLNDIMQTIKTPYFIRKYYNSIIEEFEDQLENYWIATDEELMHLVGDVNDKINQQYSV